MILVRLLVVKKAWTRVVSATVIAGGMEVVCAVDGRADTSELMSMTEEAVDWMVEELISLIDGSLVLIGVR